MTGPILVMTVATETPKRAWRSWLKVGAAVVVVLAISGYLMRNLVLGTPVDVYAVGVSDLQQTVVASGRVMTPQRVTVAAEETGRVVRIPVKEGQRVIRGDLLIELDARDERASLAQSRASLGQEQARLRQLREVDLPGATQDLRKAEADAAQAERQLVRVRELKTQGFVGQAQLDDASRNRDVAASAVSSARLMVQTHRPSGSDAALAGAAVAQARANTDMAQVRLDHDSILSPADGALIARSVEVGDIVQAGKELMVLAADGETQIVVQVDEKNLGKLKLGQAALGSADAFPTQRFEAIVSFINPGVDAARGSVEIRLTVPKPPAYLRQDMTVSVDIATARRSKVLVVPAGAVRGIGAEKTWVMAVRSRHTVRVPIDVGLTGDSRSEVLRGVADGEFVVPATAATVLVGQKVRSHVIASP